MTPALVSRRLQASSRDLGLSDLLPGARRPPSPAWRGRPPSRPAPRRPVTRQQSPALGPWEGLPWARVLPYSLLASLKSPGGNVAGEGDRPVPVGGHSPLPLFPRRGGAGARFPRPPPNASWRLRFSLRVWPRPPTYSIASSTGAASKAEAGGGKGEGRGGTGEEEYGRGKKNERPAGQGMTSLPTDWEGAEPRGL